MLQRCVAALTIAAAAVAEDPLSVLIDSDGICNLPIGPKLIHSDAGAVAPYVEDIIGTEQYVVARSELSRGNKNAIRQVGPKHRDISAIHDRSRLWPDGIIPYEIDGSVGKERPFLERAIARWNRRTVITLVPRTSQSDFVRFTAEEEGCRSYVGRVGGEQPVIIGNCAEFGISHEIGHVVGLYHPFERVDRDEFIMFQPGRERPSGTPATGPFDYNSNLHYPEDSGLYETIPPNMTYAGMVSSGDSDGVARLYGQTPKRTTITTNPPGFMVIVDGERVKTPVTFDWPVGTTHVVEALLRPKESFSFGRWTDGASRRRVITASRDRTWFQASYISMIRLTEVAIHPYDAGDVRTVPTLSDGYHHHFPTGHEIGFVATPTPSTPNRFLGWRTDAVHDWISSSPEIIDTIGDGGENNLSRALAAEFSANPFFVIDSNVPALPIFVLEPAEYFLVRFGVGQRRSEPAAFFKRLPANFDAARSSTIRIIAYDRYEHDQNIGTRFQFMDWSDGGEHDTVHIEDPARRGETWRRTWRWNFRYLPDVSLERVLKLPPSGGKLRLNYATEHRLFVSTSPNSSSGTVIRAPHSEDDYYQSGTTVELTASPSSGFVRWAGDVAGNTHRVNVHMDSPKRVWAVFQESESGSTPDGIDIWPRAFSFLDLGGIVSGRSEMLIANNSPDDLQFRFNPDQFWTSVQPSEGILSSGERRKVTITISAAGVDFGSHQAELAVTFSRTRDTNGTNRVDQIAINLVKLRSREGRVFLEAKTRGPAGRLRISPESHDSTYEKGSRVEIEAIPDEGWEFHSWRGTNSNDKVEGRRVEVVMDRDRSCPLENSSTGCADNRTDSIVAQFIRQGNFVIGTGEDRYGGDGGPASQAQLHEPTAIALDMDDNLYITEHARLRRVNGSTRIITTVAGQGWYGSVVGRGDGGPALNGYLSFSPAVAIDPTGNIYLSETHPYYVIRRIDGASGIITTVAGTGKVNAHALESDTAGNIYFADNDTDKVMRIDAATGVITTIAGAGPVSYGQPPTPCDGRPAKDVFLELQLAGLAIDVDGNIYVSNNSNTILDGLDTVCRIDARTGLITTFASVPRFGGAMALDEESGYLYVSNRDPVLLRFDVSTGQQDVDFSSTAPEQMPFRTARDLAFDSLGYLYAVDYLENRVHVIHPDILGRR